MKDKTLICLIAIVIVVIVLMAVCNKCKDPSPNDEDFYGEKFTTKDKNAGDTALAMLESMLSRGENIPELSDDELAAVSGDIYISKVPSNTREGMEYSKPENTRYWPYFYYSQSYNPESGGGGWPPDMYSTMRFWTPGFYTGTGWSHHLRPGMGTKFWPRNRWIRHRTQGKNAYYMLTNNDDWTHSTGDYSYPNTGLRFLGN